MPEGSGVCHIALSHYRNSNSTGFRRLCTVTKLPRSSGTDLRRSAKVVEKRGAVDVIDWQFLLIVCYATQHLLNCAVSFAPTEADRRNSEPR